MIRKLAIGLGLAVGAAGLTGCGSASSAAKDVAAAKPNTTEMMKAADAEKKRLADEATAKAADATKKAEDAGKDGVKKVEDAARDGVKKVEDAGKGILDKGKDLLDKGKDMVGDKAKEEILKPIGEAMPKIEEKIKGLSGATATEAGEKFTAFKKMLEEFKAAPADKMVEMGGKLKTAFDELKKKIGL